MSTEEQDAGDGEMIGNTEELLKAIKELCEENFLPNGYYYVDKLVRDGQTSIVLHILYDSLDEDYYPESGGNVHEKG